MEKKAVLGLAEIQYVPTDKADTVIMELTDASGKQFLFAIGPEGLGVILQRSMKLVDKWADHPELLPDTVMGDPDGTRNAIPASRITITPGRAAKECVVSIFVKTVQLSFFLPLGEFLDAAGNLARTIAPGPARPTH
jgi:hypothetical protein